MWFQYSASLCCSSSMLHRTQRLHVYTHTHISSWTILSYRVTPLQQNHSGQTTFVFWKNARYVVGTCFQFCQQWGTDVCVHARLWKQECQREITSICEFAVTRLACGPLLCTQCMEMESKSTELVSNMSGMLTYTVPDVKHIHSLLLCVCFSLSCSRTQIKDREVDKKHQLCFTGFEPCNSNHLLGEQGVREMCKGCEQFSHLFGNGHCLSLSNGKSTLMISLCLACKETRCVEVFVSQGRNITMSPLLVCTLELPTTPQNNPRRRNSQPLKGAKTVL